MDDQEFQCRRGIKKLSELRQFAVGGFVFWLGASAFAKGWAESFAAAAAFGCLVVVLYCGSKRREIEASLEARRLLGE